MELISASNLFLQALSFLKLLLPTKGVFETHFAKSSERKSTADLPYRNVLDGLIVVVLLLLAISLDLGLGVVLVLILHTKQVLHRRLTKSSQSKGVVFGPQGLTIGQEEGNNRFCM